MRLIDILCEIVRRFLAGVVVVGILVSGVVRVVVSSVVSVVVSA